MRSAHDYIVVGTASVSEARAATDWCAHSRTARKPLDDAVAGRPFAGVPWYTMHKIFAGLRDAHVHADTPEALTVLVALADWTPRSTRDMSDEQMQHMLDTEHGGMTEVLADVSALTGEPKYLTLARRFAPSEDARATRRGTRHARRTALQHPDPEVRRLSSACTS